MIIALHAYGKQSKCDVLRRLGSFQRFWNAEESMYTHIRERKGKLSNSNMYTSLLAVAMTS